MTKKKDKNKECFFCLFSSTKEGKKSIFLENDDCYALCNVAPRSKYHSLIVPRKHFNNFLIKSITLNSDKQLVIEYQDSKTETKPVNSSSELQQVKSYLTEIGKNKLTLSELETSHNPSTSPKSNKVLYISLTIVSTIILEIVIYFLTRKNKK